MKCSVCNGPIKTIGVLWVHDNKDGHYAGLEMTHDAEPKNSELINELFAAREALDVLLSTEPTVADVDAAVQRILDAEEACIVVGMNLVDV